MENNPIKKTLDLSIDEMEEIDIEFSHSDGSQLITFILGEEKYGLEILKVRELISYPEGLTRIPGMPDLGNIMWNYDVPEEDFDESISKMASISKYWHCKNLFRIYHPENNRSVYEIIEF